MASPAEFNERMEFTDVRVVPNEVALEGRIFGCLFRGGPLWPDFKRQVLARQCRGATPRPVDERPRSHGADAQKVYPRAVWCGPVVGHFGHMIADFGMRIAAAAHFEPDAHFLFSGRPDTWPGVLQPPRVLYDFLHIWGVPLERVRILRRPVHARSLIVYPQAERLGGGAPSEAYLDFLQTVSPPVRPRAEKDIDALYVSRAGFLRGGLAAESYLEEVMAGVGAVVIRPETVPLFEQLEIYGRARRLVFCEGSALHTLQLLGRLDAEVVVICRRPGQRLGLASLLPRCRSVTYVDALAGIVFGLRPNGLPQASKGIGVLQEKRFLERMAEAGLDLRRGWSSSDYRRRRDFDLERWRTASAEARTKRTIEPILVDGLTGLAQLRDH